MYKHLLKHNIAKMSDVFSWAQPYIQLEEPMKASFNHSVKPSDDGGKSKSTHKTPDHAQDWHQGETSLQETGVSTPKLQIDGTLHSVEAPDQQSLQHLQRPAMG